MGFRHCVNSNNYEYQGSEVFDIVEGVGLWESIRNVCPISLEVLKPCKTLKMSCRTIFDEKMRRQCLMNKLIFRLTNKSPANVLKPRIGYSYNPSQLRSSGRLPMYNQTERSSTLHHSCFKRNRKTYQES